MQLPENVSKKKKDGYSNAPKQFSAISTGPIIRWLTHKRNSNIPISLTYTHTPMINVTSKHLTHMREHRPICRRENGILRIWGSQSMMRRHMLAFSIAPKLNTV